MRNMEREKKKKALKIIEQAGEIHIYSLSKLDSNNEPKSNDKFLKHMHSKCNN